MCYEERRIVLPFFFIVIVKEGLFLFTYKSQMDVCDFLDIEEGEGNMHFLLFH